MNLSLRRWAQFLPPEDGSRVERSWGTAERYSGIEQGFCEPGRFLAVANMERGGYSSMHSHRTHANGFWAERGIVAVIVESDEKSHGYTIDVIGGKNTNTVWAGAGKIHAFACLSESARVIERYDATGPCADPVPLIRRFTPSGSVSRFLLPMPDTAKGYLEVLLQVLAAMESDSPLVCAGLAGLASGRDLLQKISEAIS